MDASPKRNAMVLQFLHFTKACTLIFSVRFQDKLQRLAHLCTLDETQNFLLRGHEEQRQKCLEFVVRWSSVLSLSIDGLCGPTAQEEITWSKTATWRRPSSCPDRPIHWPE